MISDPFLEEIHPIRKDYRCGTPYDQALDAWAKFEADTPAIAALHPYGTEYELIKEAFIVGFLTRKA